MTERFYSYREFARIVGISPQTLSELIKKNKVHVNSAGQVPESEVEYFIRRKLKKGLEEGSTGSFLYITVGKTGEELQAYKETFGDQMIEVASIENLVEEARQSLFRIKTDGATVNRIHRQHTVSILKELVKRSHEAALRCISRCADLPEVNGFSLVSLYEMFMYDHLYTDKGGEEEIRQCLSKGVLSDGSSPLGTMEAAYKSIVVSLHIVADKISKRPLISRADWNPDTVQMIRGMSEGGDIPDNDFIKKFFTMSLIPDLKTRSRKDGLEALKILRTVQTKTASTCAAPNLKRYKGRIKNAEIQAVFQERLERIIRLALNYNCEVLILGAFGCGAFGNSPGTVALASYKVLEKYRYCFDTIEFAIYCSDRDTGNYDAFKFIERRMKER